MTNFKLGRWLLVALAIVGLAFAPGLVSAHGTETTADDAPPYDAADDWATWMESHMTDYMGPGAVEWMASHAGVTVDEMAREMADDDYHDDGRYGHDDHNDGRYGQGHC